jgi:septal ring factor EnvC (AmiA/AmiB activator)
MRTIIRLMVLLALSGAASAIGSDCSSAQDVPGIENCMAEKQIDRRTSCLQSNINYLKTTVATEVGKARMEVQAKLDDAARQIDALKLAITGLQDQIKKLQADVAEAKLKAEPVKPNTK